MIHPTKDPTLTVLRRQAIQTIQTILDDIVARHGEITIKAIISKITHEANEALLTGDDRRFKKIVHEIVDEAPASMSMVFMFTAIAELAVYLEPLLRKDDTDERKPIDHKGQ